MATNHGDPLLQNLWAQESTGKIPSGDVRLNVMHSHPGKHVVKNLWGQDIKTLMAAAEAAKK